ncbi:MAG: hypothetical protein II788_02405 [Acholeplasmatales bacterium]|nr:hypothetical protein [Acholeplasmatales bacterium]
MENYFAYYKGYKENKNIRNTNPILVLAITILLLLTLASGLLGIILSLAKGKSFSEIFSLAPILVIMTFLSMLLVIPNFLFYLYLIKSKKEKATWKNIKVYLENNEEISIQSKIDQDILYLKTWKIISIRKEDIEEIIREDKIKMIFHFDKEYYILFNAIDFDALNFGRCFS